MAFELPPLPFAKDALEPHMSAKTLEFHHGKHHAAYVKKLNKLIKDTPLANEAARERSSRRPAKDESKAGDLQQCRPGLEPHLFLELPEAKGGGGKPSGDIAKRIDSDLGGYDKFVEEFKQAGDDPVRQRLGLAGARQRQAQDHQDAERRQSAVARPDRAADRSTSGSTPTISTTRTGGPISSAPSSITWSTGITRRESRGADTRCRAKAGLVRRQEGRGDAAPLRQQHIVGPAGGAGIHRIDDDADALRNPARSAGGASAMRRPQPKSSTSTAVAVPARSVTAARLSTVDVGDRRQPPRSRSRREIRSPRRHR